MGGKSWKEAIRQSFRRARENLTPQPPSLRGKGEPDSLQECRGGVFFRESIPMPKLPTGRQGYCIGGLIKDLRSGNVARLNLCCVGEDGCCREELF